MNNEKQLNISCGWGGLISLILVIAKMTGIINISWQLCFAPLAMSLVAMVILAIIAVVGIIIVNRY